MKEYATVEECVDQVKSCVFQDELGHPIENNIGFIQLVERAKGHDDGTSKNHCYDLIGKGCFYVNTSQQKVSKGICKDVRIHLRKFVDTYGVERTSETIHIWMVSEHQVDLGVVKRESVAFSNRELLGLIGL